ncbi:MAG: TlpA disulfide reductase family protein [Ferruginibacter sp.]
MYIQKILIAVGFVAAFVACNNEVEKGKFVLNGELKNIADQQVYLEQLFLNGQDPQVLDTSDVKGGLFNIGSIASEEGLYRIRFEKMNSGFIFINDQPSINFKADIKDVSLEGPDFSSPANQALKKLLLKIENMRSTQEATGKAMDSLRLAKAPDSIIVVQSIKLQEITNGFSKFITNYIDTVSHPAVAMFALGYTNGIDPAILNTIIPNMATRFPGNVGVAGLVAQFNNMITEMNKPQSPSATGAPGVGSEAPDFTMNDSTGKPFKLSSLRGKYVLVDFWASWCGPCREENPNVVAAYTQFKNKKFTVLGVSLDESKEKWLRAVAKDQLNWMHVSDLKGWENATVGLYGYDGIPYNVLIDPKGKIIATSLRASALQATLAKVLK